MDYRKNAWKFIAIAGLLSGVAANETADRIGVKAAIQKEIVNQVTSTLTKYMTSDFADVPLHVLSDQEKYHFVEQVLTTDWFETTLLETAKQFDYEAFTKDDDFTWSEEKAGRASADHHEQVGSQLIEAYQNLSAAALDELLKLAQAQDLDTNSSKKSEVLSAASYDDLPDFVKKSADPQTEYNLKVTEGVTQLTTDRDLAASQPNFADEGATTEIDDQATPIDGKADQADLDSGKYIQLPDSETISKDYVENSAEEADLLDLAVRGILTILGNPVITGVIDTITGYSPDLNSLTMIKPNGVEGVDYMVAGQHAEAWQDANITDQPLPNTNYVDRDDSVDDSNVLARKWEEFVATKRMTPFAQLEADAAAGYIIRDHNGQLVTDINQLPSTGKNIFMSAYDFDEEAIEGTVGDYTEDYMQLNPTNDLSDGDHVKAALEFVPDVVVDKGMYTKKPIYIRDLYTVDQATGKAILNTSKLIGQKGVDWDYTHVLDTNGTPKMVTSANLHIPGHALSIAQEGVEFEDHGIYEYWEKLASGVYVKTNWKYVVAELWDVELHKHDLDGLQDAYNLGVGTLNTWSVLRSSGDQAAYQTDVDRQISRGGTNQNGGISSWATSMMKFKRVDDENNPLGSTVNNTGFTGPGLYRTSVVDYGGLWDTPADEIQNDYIFMEVTPYLDANGDPVIDASGVPVYQWDKYYYTDKLEYYALDRITAYDYGYNIKSDPLYYYEISEEKYQTRELLTDYYLLNPDIDSRNILEYSYRTHAYAPTKQVEHYSYRPDDFTWESYDATLEQPYYREKESTPYYRYKANTYQYSWDEETPIVIPQDAKTADTQVTSTALQSTTKHHQLPSLSHQEVIEISIGGLGAMGMVMLVHLVRRRKS